MAAKWPLGGQLKAFTVRHVKLHIVNSRSEPNAGELHPNKSRPEPASFSQRKISANQQKSNSTLSRRTNCTKLHEIASHSKWLEVTHLKLILVGKLSRGKGWVDLKFSWLKIGADRKFSQICLPHSVRPFDDPQSTYRIDSRVEISSRFYSFEGLDRVRWTNHSKGLELLTQKFISTKLFYKLLQKLND